MGEKKLKKEFTIKNKVALVMLALVDFMSFCSMSILAPFYPHEASLKGMSESTSGVVFGFYALVIFISSPIFGKIIPKMGVKLSYILGVLTCGACNVIFGTLHNVNSYKWFTILSFVIRGLEALGASAYSTAGYVLVINIFPENAGAVRGLLETFVGLGMSAGPAIGGFLFAIGGFGLPFYVLGLTIVVLAPLNICLLPPYKGDGALEERKSGSLINLLKLPCIQMTCFIIVITASTWGFLDPTLEPHLRQYKLSPTKIGLIFLLLSATYGIFSPIFGWISDKVKNYWVLMPLGLLCSSMTLLLLGPSPIFTFLEGALWMDVVALSCLGISVAMALIPTYQSIMDCALNTGGFSETLGTHSVIAGLWSCVYSLGEVVGPVAGGASLQYLGFPMTSTIFAVANFIASLISFTYFIFYGYKVFSTPIAESVVAHSYRSTTTEISIIKDKDNK